MQPQTVVKTFATIAADETQRDWLRYRDLVSHVATLSARESRELYDLAARLKKSPQDVQSDALLVEEANGIRLRLEEEKDCVEKLHQANLRVLEAEPALLAAHRKLNDEHKLLTDARAEAEARCKQRRADVRRLAFVAITTKFLHAH